MSALPLLLALGTPAWAEDLPAAANVPPQASAPDQPVQEAGATVDFSADTVTYDSEAELVVAEGNVRMARDGNYLAADRVRWDRNSGQVFAEGNVVAMNPRGDKAIGERIELTDTLRDGTIENLLVVLETGGRIAAERGTRQGKIMRLENAVYSACPVVGADGCPKNPSWKISAVEVSRDSEAGRIRFRGGRINILGLTIPLLPAFSIGDGSQKGGVTGAILPGFRVDSNNGVELTFPYYWRFNRSMDLLVSPHIYSGTYPALEAQWRQLTSFGAYQLSGFLTYSHIPPSDVISPTTTSSGRDGLRGYFEGNGRFQLSPNWTLQTSVRVATDKTVTRRYDITRDDRLRSFVNAERITPDSYLSIAGWAFEGLRVDDIQKQIPIALPAIDWRMRIGDPVLGGRIQFQANSLAILRIDGQDTQRAFVSAEWDRRFITTMGQELTLTGYARGDVYHTRDSAATDVALYRGEDGWHFRGIGALAADVRWPLVGSFLGGIQRLTPRIQLVLTPPTSNLAIPNEDARAVDLEDSNLFALNRFPGYDRWEDSSRLTYGFEWNLDRPNWSIQAVVGQSYRFRHSQQIIPDGTGFSGKFSDIVGRTRIRFGRLVDITHRYRVDKDTFAIRRNELDLTVGTDLTYVQAGYLRLNRDISSTIEDLSDKEEVRLAARWQFHRFWSVYGSTVIDLTGKTEDPLSLADGYEPVRHRLGINYEDDCLQLGVGWKRDYERIGEFRKGNTFSINFALKGIGR